MRLPCLWAHPLVLATYVNLIGVEAPKDIIVPVDLITEDAIKKKFDEIKPHWVPVTIDPTRQDSLDDLQAKIDDEFDSSKDELEMDTEETPRDNDIDEEAEDDKEEEDEDDEEDEPQDEEEDDVTHEDTHSDNTAARRKRRKAEPVPRLIHKPSGIVLLELSNGIRVNYMYSSYYQKRCTIRVTR